MSEFCVDCRNANICLQVKLREPYIMGPELFKQHTKGVLCNECRAGVESDVLRILLQTMASSAANAP